MASTAQDVSNWTRSPVRWLMWGGAAALLLLPAVAMQFTAEVNWGPGDFAIMGGLFALCCGTMELGARLSPSWAYRAAVGIAVLVSFLMIWMNLAAGIIGSENNPANLMFAAVIAVAAVGAVIARGRAPGMALAMAAGALGQIVLTAVALIGDMGAGEPVWPVAFTFLMTFFTLMWLGAAWLFRTAAQPRERP